MIKFNINVNNIEFYKKYLRIIACMQENNALYLTDKEIQLLAEIMNTRGNPFKGSQRTEIRSRLDLANTTYSTMVKKLNEKGFLDKTLKGFELNGTLKQIADIVNKGLDKFNIDINFNIAA